MYLGFSDPNFVQGLSFMDILILPVELSWSTPITVQNERSFDVLVKDAENTQGKWQKGHFRHFSRPWFTWAPK